MASDLLIPGIGVQVFMHIKPILADSFLNHSCFVAFIVKSDEKDVGAESVHQLYFTEGFQLCRWHEQLKENVTEKGQAMIE